VAVAVQGDRRRLVAKVVLHGLDAGALVDQQARDLAILEGPGSLRCCRLSVKDVPAIQ
jgi:hypothetical protein